MLSSCSCSAAGLGVGFSSTTKCAPQLGHSLASAMTYVLHLGQRFTLFSIRMPQCGQVGALDDTGWLHSGQVIMLISVVCFLFWCVVNVCNDSTKVVVFADIHKKKCKKFCAKVKKLYLCSAKTKKGALAHLARAFDWQSRGGEFESRMLHFPQINWLKTKNQSL